MKSTFFLKVKIVSELDGYIGKTKDEDPVTNWSTQAKEFKQELTTQSDIRDHDSLKTRLTGFINNSLYVSSWAAILRPFASACELAGIKTPPRLKPALQAIADGMPTTKEFEDALPSQNIQKRNKTLTFSKVNNKGVVEAEPSKSVVNQWVKRPNI